MKTEVKVDIQVDERVAREDGRLIKGEGTNERK